MKGRGAVLVGVMNVNCDRKLPCIIGVASKMQTIIGKIFLDTVPDIPAYSLIKTVQVGYQTRNGFSHNKIANSLECLFNQSNLFVSWF